MRRCRASGQSWHGVRVGNFEFCTEEWPSLGESKRARASASTSAKANSVVRQLWIAGGLAEVPADSGCGARYLEFRLPGSANVCTAQSTGLRNSKYWCTNPDARRPVAGRLGDVSYCKRLNLHEAGHGFCLIAKMGRDYRLEITVGAACSTTT